MTDREKELWKAVKDLSEVFRKLESSEKTVSEQRVYIEELRTEIRKLKYEYSDSILKRDEPLPYKWQKSNGYMHQFCPKCEMMISNWQGYCHACGQKIKQGNPLPEMEVKGGNEERSDKQASGD